ncbi:N-terminal phage integrase SAM-like domain-containing protein [Kribbella pratensis]|uniref:N-terminal phage integrase SAM-like domain-containing protein n=1 Tax=Kribbella pratensis TaxID=2512112 RepID=UPI001416F7D6
MPGSGATHSRQAASGFKPRWGRGRRWRGVWHDPSGKDPTTLIRYETALRLYVLPYFGSRPVKSIKPSEIATWLTDLEERITAKSSKPHKLTIPPPHPGGRPSQADRRAPQHIMGWSAHY